MDIVFISYAREDKSIAEKIYMDLRRNEISSWIDSRCLLPGENWQNTIKHIIKTSKCFILLVSKYSISKRGYVQKEIKEALKVLEEVPTNKTFLIPVRLDDTIPVDEALQNLNWVDLYKSYSDGLNRIVTALSLLEKEPLKYLDAINKTERRAPIQYSPYESFDDFIRQIIEKLPVSTEFTNLNCPYYITFKTVDPLKTKIPQYLLEQYPNLITIVLQYQYKLLTIYEQGFTVRVLFKGIEEHIGVAFSEIVKIEMPSLGIHIGRC